MDNNEHWKWPNHDGSHNFWIMNRTFIADDIPAHLAIINLLVSYWIALSVEATKYIMRSWNRLQYLLNLHTNLLHG